METIAASNDNIEQQDNQSSCTPGLTRKQFFDRVIARAGQTGTLIIAATLIDKFQPLPPVAAASESE